MSEHSRPDLDAIQQGIEAALRRAALNARETARRTGAPLVTWQNGKVVEEIICDEPETRRTKREEES